MTRLSRDDIVAGAGRRFARYGYHGTSMRDLGQDLGILGSSIYAHVGGKQELLIAVVERGAAFFDAAAAGALAEASDPMDALQRLIRAHIDVLLDHRSEARTYLAEVSFLEDADRVRLNGMRRDYEQVFEDAIAAASEAGAIDGSVDPRLAALYTLSILNRIERWFREDGPLTRDELAVDVFGFVCGGLYGTGSRRPSVPDGRSG